MHVNSPAWANKYEKVRFRLELSKINWRWVFFIFKREQILRVHFYKMCVKASLYNINIFIDLNYNFQLHGPHQWLSGSVFKNW